MLTVYRIDDTRLVLPDSRWGRDVLKALVIQGKHVEITDEDPDLVQHSRSADESDRAMALIDSTGI
jgi:hypothetical protein